METPSLTGALWGEKPFSRQHSELLAERFDLPEVVARCMASRWPDEETPSLTPSLDDLHDPYTMHGMPAAVDRLKKAIRDGEALRVITDYDVDGTTSSLILQATLKIVAPHLPLGYHIPDRFAEGYGFSVSAADSAATEGIGLIVTADIGVRDHAAVTRARERGLDVLICDHHLPSGASVPADATVLCPPQIDCSYPNRHLAACGVSLKLAQALLDDHPKRELILRSMLKLAAIGTVADLVPLTSAENRAIVSVGLQELNRSRHHAGLQALLDVARLQPGQVDETALGFRIGPRINAAGRVAHAREVVELLNTRDPKTASELARALDDLNTKRREIQKHLVEEATAALGTVPDPFVVVAGHEEAGWHRGVVGIVASRVKEQTYRPTAVVSIQGELAVGSVRSIPAIHAVEALDSVSDLLVRYGGHPAAAGFTVPTERIDELRERLGAFVLQNSEPSDLVPVHHIDAPITSSEVSERLVHQLDSLGPFGMGNPRPRLLMRNVLARDVQLRAQGRLLKFQVPMRSGTMEAVWWNQGHLADAIASDRIDVLGNLGFNTYRGIQRLQWRVTDVRHHTA